MSVWPAPFACTRPCASGRSKLFRLRRSLRRPPPSLQLSIMHQNGFTTTILHSDRQQPVEHGAVHQPIHTSSEFAYADARELAAVFQDRPSVREGKGWPVRVDRGGPRTS